MRLLHPETLRIVALECTDEDFNTSTVSRKQIISHAWSEVFKHLKSGKKHPKMFLNKDQLKYYCKHILFINKHLRDKCKLNIELFEETFQDCKNLIFSDVIFDLHFDDSYLFSDAVSLYFKGLNIFPYLFGDDWRKYVPVESRDEIIRQLAKQKENRK